MDNQHKLIKGYRDLTQEEIDTMNKVKELGITINNMIKEVEAKLREGSRDPEEHMRQSISEAYRWVAIAKTDYQTAQMALTRAIAQPEFF